jgi:pyruvate/2-oxoglutarate dehydrogenase complex dihydrolipoamide acyltransferase (E2) component
VLRLDLAPRKCPLSRRARSSRLSPSRGRRSIKTSADDRRPCVRRNPRRSRVSRFHGATCWRSPSPSQGRHRRPSKAADCFQEDPARLRRRRNVSSRQHIGAAADHSTARVRRRAAPGGAWLVDVGGQPRSGRNRHARAEFFGYAAANLAGLLRLWRGARIPFGATSGRGARWAAPSPPSRVGSPSTANAVAMTPSRRPRHTRSSVPTREAPMTTALNDPQIASATDPAKSVLTHEACSARRMATKK